MGDPLDIIIKKLNSFSAGSYSAHEYALAAGEFKDPRAIDALMRRLSSDSCSEDTGYACSTSLAKIGSIEILKKLLNLAEKYTSIYEIWAQKKNKSNYWRCKNHYI